MSEQATSIIAIRQGAITHVSSGAVKLWLTLLALGGYKPQCVTLHQLSQLVGCMVNSLVRWRNELVRKGLLNVDIGHGRVASIYLVRPLVAV